MFPHSLTGVQSGMGTSYVTCPGQVGQKLGDDNYGKNYAQVGVIIPGVLLMRESEDAFIDGV
jgi:hypothetical protein